MSDDPLDFERVVALLRGRPIADPAARRRILEAVRNDAPRVKSITRWLLAPRQVLLAPVEAILLTGVVAVSAAVIGSTLGRTTGHAEEEGATRLVHFVLVESGARSVSLVGDFNDWDARATPLHSEAAGVWTIAIPLRPGRYTYSFVVDGTRWVSDPARFEQPIDDFGRPSSVVVVAEGAT